MSPRLTASRWRTSAQPKLLGAEGAFTSLG